MYRGNLASLTRGALHRLSNNQTTGGAAAVALQPKNTFYSYSPEPAHRLGRKPTIVSAEEAVKCIKSCEWILCGFVMIWLNVYAPNWLCVQ